MITQKTLKALQPHLYSLCIATCTLSCAPTSSPYHQNASQQQRLKRGQSRLTLDNQPLVVMWDDGDTFSVSNHQNRKTRARLKGYNTLETYGPVHRWGTWTALELYHIAKQATTVARNGRWTCESTDEQGGYGRLLVDCPDLRHKLIREGLAHLFSIDEQATSADIETQLQAMKAGQGMWAKGIPDAIVTSLHSADEKRRGKPYNRLCSVDNGESTIKHHRNAYSTCQEVCTAGSCLVYVPYKIRYGTKKPACLRVNHDNRMANKSPKKSLL